MRRSTTIYRTMYGLLEFTHLCIGLYTSPSVISSVCPACYKTELKACNKIEDVFEAVL